MQRRREEKLSPYCSSRVSSPAHWISPCSAVRRLPISHERGHDVSPSRQAVTGGIDTKNFPNKGYSCLGLAMLCPSQQQRRSGSHGMYPAAVTIGKAGTLQELGNV